MINIEAALFIFALMIFIGYASLFYCIIDLKNKLNKHIQDTKKENSKKVE